MGPHASVSFWPWVIHTFTVNKWCRKFYRMDRNKYHLNVICRMESKEITISRGLEGIYIAETTLCKIDGANGRLWYRGYPIEVLAENSNYEEVSYLLLFGKLPNRKELSAFRERLKAERDVPPVVFDIVEEMSGRAHPMDVLRTCISSLSIYDEDPEDKSQQANIRRAIKLIAKTASIVAYMGRYRQGKDYVPPDSSLDHSANFLYMLTGKKPDEMAAKLIDLMFILHAEHGSNASTFSTLVTGSTLADVYAAVTAGAATLKGPLHGGADEAALRMMYSIGDPDNTETYIEEALEGKRRIMGFGHRVYKAYDPRAKIVRKYLELYQERNPSEEVSRLLQIALRAEKLMLEKLSKTKGIWPNIDFFAGPLYRAIDVPAELFTPIFAASRMVGWCAHLFEYWQNNRLFRPLDNYVGEVDKKYVPIDQRE